MKIRALVHFAMPWRNAGSETVLHEILKTAVAHGHDVAAYVTDCGMGPPITYDGIKLVRVQNVVQGGRLVGRDRPDVIVSHHQHAIHALRTARLVHSKMVFLTHNDMDVNARILRMKPDLVVHNSEWVKQSLARFGEQANEYVMHPPLSCTRHTTTRTGSKVTLINVNEHKGARILYTLAARMPDVEFLAVTGGHGVQILPPSTLKNVSLVAHDPDLRPVWEQTRLLVMPSIYESYGLVGIEAGCSGIPTLANVTPGLRESLGPAGLFVSWPTEHLPTPVPGIPHWENREWVNEWSKPSVGHVNEWESAIRGLLDNPDEWAHASDMATKNSHRLCEESDESLTRLVGVLKNLTRPIL